jgi:hypothetical protein
MKKLNYETKKRIVFFSCLFLFILSVIEYRGYCVFHKTVQYEIKFTDGCDMDIVNVLEKNHFHRLDVFDSPNSIDYFIAGLDL